MTFDALFRVACRLEDSALADHHPVECTKLAEAFRVVAATQMGYTMSRHPHLDAWWNYFILQEERR